MLSPDTQEIGGEVQSELYQGSILVPLFLLLYVNDL
jgi:hypothetical protein